MEIDDCKPSTSSTIDGPCDSNASSSVHVEKKEEDDDDDDKGKTMTTIMTTTEKKIKNRPRRKHFGIKPVHMSPKLSDVLNTLFV